MICNSCPRHCGIDRAVGVGVCGVPETPRVAKAYLHLWEEPCISGKNGSGTVFFSGCNLKCEFCQNYEISSGGKGKDISVEDLAKVFENLEKKGASNINLVTPSHYVDCIIKALEKYKPSIPIVYNSSGYDSLSQICKIAPYVDIFLVDFKFKSSVLAKKFCKSEDYPIVAEKAIKKMRELKPKDNFDGDMLTSGVIIRHLIMPNHIDDSIEILNWIKENMPNTMVSLMCQYTPTHNANKYDDINRTLKPIEYKIVLKKMLDLNLSGYSQELTSASCDYIPTWDCEGV